MNSAGDKHSVCEIDDSEQEDIADISGLDLPEDAEILKPDVITESAKTPLSNDNNVSVTNKNTDKTQIFQAPDFTENQIDEFAIEASSIDEVTQIMDVANIFGSHPDTKEAQVVNTHDTKIHSDKKIKKALPDSASSTNSEDPKPLIDSAKAHQKVKKLENRASDNNKKDTQLRQRKDEPSSQVSSNMSANNKTIIQKPFKKPVAPKQLEAKNENLADPAGINAKSVEKSQYDITLTPRPLQEKSKLSNNKTPIAEKNSAISKVGLNLKHRFKLIEHIGDGGMSQVYKARDLRLEAAGIENPYIAIKILSDEFGSHPEALKVMARECQKTRELCHPNIVRVFDYDTDNDINFITMELLEGESLDKVIQRAKPRGLAMKGVISILEPLCRALEYAHQHGIVHADLKPSNIFLTRSGEVKIFDFGVVRALNNQPDQYSAKNLQRDDNPKTGGYTPAYASIEMLNGGEPDLRDDLYALGCISYELITSRHPFNRTPANQIKQNEVNLARPKNISGTKWKAIKALLSLNKEARPASALVFLQQMQHNRNKLPIKIAASLAIIGTLAFYANDYNQTFLQINAAHDTEVAKSRLILDLQKANKSEIINQYQQIETFDEVTRLAFLQAFRKEIIEHYLILAQSKKMSSDEKFPDFVAQLSTIEEIQAVYADSLKLENKRQDILTSRTHLIQAKEYKFNNLLRQQQYSANQQDEDIYSLLANMRSMKPGYHPKIADDIVLLYGEAVNAAVIQQNYMQVESLMKTGNKIFPQHPEYLKLVGKGDEYHQAASLLANYQASLETESPLEFPHQQAAIFYAGLIKDLSMLIENAESKNNLDDIFEKVTEWSSKLPATFRPLDDVRKQLSGSYMSRANKLIKQGKVKSASPLFDKAEKLLSYN